MTTASKPRRLETPKKGEIYTTRQVLTCLRLDDSPCLLISPQDDLELGTVYFAAGHQVIPRDLSTSSIQTSHLSDEQILENSTFSELPWEYVRTTSEWIPVFKYAGSRDVLSALVRAEFSVDDFEVGRGRLSSVWLQPNYTPRRPQYHAYSGNEEVFVLDNLVDSREASIKTASDQGFHYRLKVREEIYRQYDGRRVSTRTYYRHYKRAEDADAFLENYSDLDTWVDTFDSHDLYRTVTKA